MNSEYIIHLFPCPLKSFSSARPVSSEVEEWLALYADFMFTGYLGGSTLLRLLKHPKRDSFDITILIRAASKAQSFESYGLRTVIGSLGDHDILERECSQTDILFQSVSWSAGHLSVI